MISSREPIGIRSCLLHEPTTSQLIVILAHTTYLTWYKVLYQHLMYVMATYYNNNISFIYIMTLGGIMIIMLASSAVNRGFDPQAGPINDNKIGTCCISAKHTALRSISKDFVGSQLEWRVWVFTTDHDLFQWSSTIKIKNTTKINGLRYADIISSKYFLFLP